MKHSDNIRVIRIILLYQNLMRETKIWYKKWWGVLLVVLAMLFLALLVAIGFYFVSLVQGYKTGNLSLNAQIDSNLTGQKYDATADTENDYWLGSANPKITIVEFADFACPFCEASFPNIRELTVEHKNDIKFIFRDFPIKQSYSADLALAARCAGEQGLFWPMYDKLFLNQGVSTQGQLEELANEIGADMNNFDSCFTSQKYLPQIQKDFTDGQNLGVKGTPTWFVNGYKLEGDIPMSGWEEIIDKFTK